MPRSISDLVADNFSKDPEYYDRAAKAQREAAETLADAIRSATAAAPPARILEIGCGTGFLTGKLAEMFPDAEIAATDISPAMLAFCERAFGKRKDKNAARIDFVLDDISKTRLREPFDLVASSFAFQWAGRLTELAPTLSRLSRPGG
jgi:malonyl-CoA O-methyltransferase